MAGFRLPITSMCLQALVSEPVKPFLDRVIMDPATGTYVSQSDKGELVVGGGLDLYPSYAQRGQLAGPGKTSSRDCSTSCRRHRT